MPATALPVARPRPQLLAARDGCFEARADGRTPGQRRHSLQGSRFSLYAPLDKGRNRRNKGIRRRPDLHARTRQQWMDREDTELELLALAFRAGDSGEQHEGR